MHDDLEPFKHKSIPKILQKPQKFQKIQNFKKTPNSRSKDMKCMIKGWKRIIPEREAHLETKKWVGKLIWVRERSLGMWEVKNCRERSRETRSES